MLDAASKSVLAWPGRSPAQVIARNPGVPFDLAWLDGLRVNQSAVGRRASTLGTRRTVKKDWQAAWLLKAITCIDLTTLNGDDTTARVERLCAKARRPIRDDLLDALGMPPGSIKTGAVCVYHRFVQAAVEALDGTGIPVAAVSTGFPAGLIPHPLKLREIEASVADGAAEIDIVVTREHVLTGNWQALYDEVRDFREACGDAHVKTILATGDIRTLSNVAKASMVCMMAGADFIKTSTGKEGVNATLDVSLVMVRMIREYLERTGVEIGFKPAGGVSTAKSRARLPDPDEGRARARVARSRPVPHRRIEPARRHRAAARTSRHRPLLVVQPSSRRVIARSHRTESPMCVAETLRSMDYGPAPEERPAPRAPGSMQHAGRFGHFIDGTCRRARTGDEADASTSREPGDGQRAAQIAQGSDGRRRRRRRCRARRAQPAWAALGGARPRAASLCHRPPGAEARAPLRGARNDRQRQADPRDPRHRHPAGRPPLLPSRRLGRSCMETRVRRLRAPVGVCGQIIPWNFPLLMLAWKIAPALAPATPSC